MARAADLIVSCLCGAIRQTITPRIADTLAFDVRATKNLEQDVFLCNCRACRKGTGLLMTSWYSCGVPSDGGLNGMTIYEVSQGERRYFCEACGGCIFRELRGGKDNERGRKDGVRWEVATGVLEALPGIDLLRFVGHVNVSSTGDGGAAVWLQEIDGQTMPLFEEAGPDNYLTNLSPRRYTIPERFLKQQLVTSTRPKEAEEDVGEDILKASCLCGIVKFHITRPDESSRLPKSNFPDLIKAYHTQDPEIQNPQDKKWWLRGQTKYLAGTCACRSCRLASGFEVQTWVFVPRPNIFFHIKGDSDSEIVVPVDFGDERVRGVLRHYESSEGVIREFCGGCGATVLWHDKWRPDLIDVSVGLLESWEGARAESWLDWWTDRVSFVEDAEGSGCKLVAGLESGLAGWGKRAEGGVNHGADVPDAAESKVAREKKFKA